MKTIVLVEASEVTQHYGEELINKLKKYEQFFKEDSNELVIPTNSVFRTSDQLLLAFNVYMKQLNFTGTFQIRIRL